jgi:ubiquinone/menaquinone biosynthesis C-methylase UbiE
MNMDTTVLPLLPRVSNAGAVFDQIATEYDQIFTDSLIGRAQRDAVWKVLTRTFKPDDNILELNCGTGEDAIFLAGKGISLFACDASQQMIAIAEERLRHQSPSLPVVFCHLPTERIKELNPETMFDGAFSNFSGLNCVNDLGAVAASLTDLVKEGGHLLFCFSNRFCLIEVAHYLMRGQWQKALRRWNGHTVATLSDLKLPVYYPGLRQIRRHFAPHFTLRSYIGVGVAVPPSYCEKWVRQHRGVFRVLCRLEEILSPVPGLRLTGDHILLCFKKVSK